jgi:DNA-binding transcriptional MerR regulator
LSAATLTIGRLATAANVNVETVRYYQRRGLLPEPERPSGGVRRYGADHVRGLIIPAAYRLLRGRTLSRTSSVASQADAAT